VIFSNVFGQGRKVRAEVYIDLQDKDRNKKVFDRLHEQQAAIENEYGAALTWERLDDRRASRIAAFRDGSIDDPPETRTLLMQWSIANLLKLRKVLLPKAKEVVAGIEN
jgi:hypothetical protein